VVSTTPRPLYPRERPVPIIQEGGSIWTCAKNFAPIGIRSPDRPARSQSIYRLNYPGLLLILCHTQIETSNKRRGPVDITPFHYSGYLRSDSDRTSMYTTLLHGFSQSLPLNTIYNTMVCNYPIIRIKITTLSDVIAILEQSASNNVF
jgi:hypothetical protein